MSTKSKLKKCKKKYEKEIRKLEQRYNTQRGQLFLYYLFFNRKGKTGGIEGKALVKEFVEFVYREGQDWLGRGSYESENKEYGCTTQEVEKDLVATYHDETYDLSTLECTGGEFKPWEKGQGDLCP